ncbi:MAG: acyl-CoA synthetase [Catenulispora sp.]
MTPRGPGTREEAFSTSGQSGEPIVWFRTEEQLRVEADLLARTLIGQVDRVVSYAPTTHLYGRLLGDVLPTSLRVPVQHVWDSPTTVPDLASGDRVLLVCLPSTWLMLRSLAERAANLATVTAVHSTGPTTPAMHQLLSRVEGSGFRAVEILGSTETGGVAHRTLLPRPQGRPLWTLFDDVDLVADPEAGPDAGSPADPTGAAERPLCVRSPRIARRADMERPPDRITLDDLVRPVGERRFELLGRATRMIKINGRRVRLEDVESAVRERFPHVDLVCVPRQDEVRAEHYELFYAAEAGTVTVQDIHALVAAAFPGVPVPRRVQRVGTIPRSATGKVRVDRLLAAAHGRSGSGAEAVGHVS